MQKPDKTAQEVDPSQYEPLGCSTPHHTSYHFVERADIPNYDSKGKLIKYRAPYRSSKKRSDNRHLLVCINPEMGLEKSMNVFIDAAHAALVMNLDIKDIKSDMLKGTNITKRAWLKIAAGKSLNQAQIKKSAIVAFKEWQQRGGLPQKTSSGRKPVSSDKDQIMALLQNIDYSKLNEETLKELKSILS